MEINKWCQKHWDALHVAIDARGMNHLIPKGGEAAAAMMVDEIRFGDARDSEGFDPLMRAFWAISGRVMEQGGNPIDCPLCQIQCHEDTCKDQNCKQTSPQQWIDSCTDSLLEYAKSKGLLRDSPQSSR